MDNESERELEECVLRILKHGDPNKLTESKVRKLAADETGFDLRDPANREIVKRTVENYFSKPQENASHQKMTAWTKERKPLAKQPPQIPGRRRNLILDDDEDDENDTRTNGSKSNPEESEQPDASVESEEEDKKERIVGTAKKRRADDTEHEDSERANGKKHTAQSVFDGKNFPNGEHPVCELSKNRFIVVQDFNGKTLISIREYYEKDGQLLPTRKGISLTVEQWHAVKKGIPNIEAAIKGLKR